LCWLTSTVMSDVDEPKTERSTWADVNSEDEDDEGAAPCLAADLPDDPPFTVILTAAFTECSLVVIEDTFYDCKVAGFWTTPEQGEAGQPPKSCFVEFWNRESLENALIKTGIVELNDSTVHVAVAPLGERHNPSGPPKRSFASARQDAHGSQDFRGGGGGGGGGYRDRGPPRGGSRGERGGYNDRGGHMMHDRRGGGGPGFQGPPMGGRGPPQHHYGGPGYGGPGFGGPQDHRRGAPPPHIMQHDHRGGPPPHGVRPSMGGNGMPHGYGPNAHGGVPNAHMPPAGMGNHPAQYGHRPGPAPLPAGFQGYGVPHGALPPAGYGANAMEYPGARGARPPPHAFDPRIGAGAHPPHGPMPPHGAPPPQGQFFPPPPPHHGGHPAGPPPGAPPQRKKLVLLPRSTNKEGAAQPQDAAESAPRDSDEQVGVETSSAPPAASAEATSADGTEAELTKPKPKSNPFGAAVANDPNKFFEEKAVREAQRKAEEAARALEAKVPEACEEPQTEEVADSAQEDSLIPEEPKEPAPEPASASPLVRVPTEEVPEIAHSPGSAGGGSFEEEFHDCHEDRESDGPKSPQGHGTKPLEMDLVMEEHASSSRDPVAEPVRHSDNGMGVEENGGRGGYHGEGGGRRGGGHRGGRGGRGAGRGRGGYPPRSVEEGGGRGGRGGKGQYRGGRGRSHDVAPDSQSAHAHDGPGHTRKGEASRQPHHRDAGEGRGGGRAGRGGAGRDGGGRSDGRGGGRGGRSHNRAPPGLDMANAALAQANAANQKAKHPLPARVLDPPSQERHAKTTNPYELLYMDSDS